MSFDEIFDLTAGVYFYFCTSAPATIAGLSVVTLFGS